VSFVIADRVRETTSTTGTGALSLLGAWPQFQAFVTGVGSGNNCEYTLLDGNGTDWEVGLGTSTSGTPNTLSRDKVLASSNGNALLNLSSNVHTVFLTRSAASYRATLGAPVVPPPVVASWTQQNISGSATVTNVANGVALYDAWSGAANQTIRGITMAAPATPYTIDANLVGASLLVAGATTSYLNFGIGWSDGTKLQYIEATNVFLGNSNTNANEVAVNNFSNYSTYASTAGGIAYGGVLNPANIFLRIRDDGTNITLSIGNDGVTYLPVYTAAKSAAYLGSSGYTNVGAFFRSGQMATGGFGNVTLRSWWPH
jgi:hypothetical protein